MLHELTNQNNYLSATQDQISKSEAELTSSVNLLKNELHDLQRKCESFDNESLSSLLTAEAEGVKRSQKKLDEQRSINKSVITEAKYKLEQKKAAYEKDIQAWIANKDAHIQGMKDSVVRTRSQNERELEKLKSHLVSLQSKESELRTQCEDLDKTVAEQNRKQVGLERRKKIMETLEINRVAAFASQDNLLNLLPTSSKSTIRQTKLDNLNKRMKFDVDSSLGSSCDDYGDHDPIEQVTYKVVAVVYINF